MMMQNVLISLLLSLITIFGAVIILLVQCAKKSSEDKKKGNKKKTAEAAKKQKKDSKGSKDNTKMNKMAPKGKQPLKSIEPGKGKNSSKTIAVFTAEEYGRDELTALLETAVKPDPETMKQLKKMKIDKKRKPVMIPPKQKGGTATVILMPPRDMQSTLLITAMPEPVPGKKKEEPKDEEYSVEVSKRKDGGEDSKKGEGGSFSLE